MKLHRILLPLDGSVLAEQILPHAIKLAKLNRSKLLLFRSAKPGSVAASQITTNQMGLINQSQTYLNKVRDLITNSDTPLHLEADRVKTIVIYGEANDNIRDIANFENVDLIMMTTHGRTGSLESVLGNVAASVIHNSNLPVIVLRPENTREPMTLNNLLASDYEAGGPIVLTLDINEKNSRLEAIIEPTIAIARLLGTSIHLLTVIDSQPETNDYGYFSNSAHTEELWHTAKTFLSRVQSQIQIAGGIPCQSIIREGKVSEQTIEYSREVGAQLLTIGTHAPNAPRSVIFGSVATKLISQSCQPVLLINKHRYNTTAVWQFSTN